MTLDPTNLTIEEELFEALEKIEARATQARKSFQAGTCVNGRTALSDIEQESRYAILRAQERIEARHTALAGDAPDQWELAR